MTNLNILYSSFLTDHRTLIKNVKIDEMQYRMLFLSYLSPNKPYTLLKAVLHLRMVHHNISLYISQDCLIPY